MHKFIPTATVTRNKIRRQLSQDNKAFERRVRLKYIFHGLNKTIHSLYVKSNWEPPVQSSAKLENYTEEEKLQNCHAKNETDMSRIDLVSKNLPAIILARVTRIFLAS